MLGEAHVNRGPDLARLRFCGDDQQRAERGFSHIRLHSRIPPDLVFDSARDPVRWSDRQPDDNPQGRALSPFSGSAAEGAPGCGQNALGTSLTITTAEAATSHVSVRPALGGFAALEGACAQIL